MDHDGDSQGQPLVGGLVEETSIYEDFARFEFMGQSTAPSCWVINKKGRWREIKTVDYNTPPNLEDFDSVDEYCEVFDSWEVAKESWDATRKKFMNGHYDGSSHTHHNNNGKWN